MDFSGSTSSSIHPVLACAAAIEEDLKTVTSIDPTFMTPGEKREALVALDARISQLEALRMRVVAASGDMAKDDGYRSTGCWLARHVRKDRGRMVGLERLAVDLDTKYAAVAAGLAEGRVNVDQAAVVVRALNDLGSDVQPGVMAKAEIHLVECCAEFAPKQLRRLGRKILEVIAPDVFEDEERKRLERELRRAQAAIRLSITNRGDGSSDVRGRIPEGVAARFKTLLEGFTSPRRDNVTGRGFIDPATGERLPSDRVLGEAFCSLLERIDPAVLPLHGGVPTSVTVTIDLAHLMNGLGSGTLDDGTPISAGEVRRLACTAGMIPAVLNGKSEVLDLGRSQRLFSPAQRRALAVMHRTCQADGCEVKAAWTEVHHWREPWAKGGKTDLKDGMLLCAWHHHRAHDPTCRMELIGNSKVKFHKRT